MAEPSTHPLSPEPLPLPEAGQHSSAPEPPQLPEPGQPSLLLRLQDEHMREEFVAFRAGKRHVEDAELELISSYVMSDECPAALQRLYEGAYDFPVPRQLMLRKSHSNRRRIIYAFPKEFNTLLKYLVWGLHEYDGLFSPSLYSFRMGRSTESLFRLISHKGAGTRFWAAKADVHDYGHSIVPAHLIPMLQQHVGARDSQLFDLFEALLTFNTYTREGEVVHANMGGLPGVPVGVFFNNVYLMELDAQLHEQVPLYSRYADDLCAFTNTREEAEAALGMVRAEMDRLDIALNESKSLVIAPGDDVELLGICIRGSELDVADSTLAKARNKLKHYCDRLVLREQRAGMPRDVAARLMVSKVNRYFFGKEGAHELSWRDFFFRTITRPDSLQELDRYCQDLIRIAATGKRGDARYRFRYADMQALGYRPLTSDYWELRHAADQVED